MDLACASVGHASPVRVDASTQLDPAELDHASPVLFDAPEDFKISTPPQLGDAIATAANSFDVLYDALSSRLETSISQQCRPLPQSATSRLVTQGLPSNTSSVLLD
eukprot:8415447-Karenia_brevis.AAC.1